MVRRGSPPPDAWPREAGALPPRPRRARNLLAAGLRVGLLSRRFRRGDRERDLDRCGRSSSAPHASMKRRRTRAARTRDRFRALLPRHVLRTRRRTTCRRPRVRERVPLPRRTTDEAVDATLEKRRRTRRWRGLGSMNPPSVAAGPTLLPLVPAAASRSRRRPPVWIMRQGGPKKLPSSRVPAADPGETSNSFPSMSGRVFPGVCRGDGAADRAVRNSDAAILFQDILSPLPREGWAVPGRVSILRPKLGFQIRTRRRSRASLRWWRASNAAAPHIRPVIRAVRPHLQGACSAHRASPDRTFTMAAYLVDAGSRDLGERREAIPRSCDPEASPRGSSISLRTPRFDLPEGPDRRGAWTRGDALRTRRRAGSRRSSFARTARVADRRTALFCAGFRRGTPHGSTVALAPSVGHLEALARVRARSCFLCRLDFRAVAGSRRRAILGNLTRGGRETIDPCGACSDPARRSWIRAGIRSFARKRPVRSGPHLNLGWPTGSSRDTPIDSVTLLVDNP
jgi:hypothetical protein